MTVILTSPAEGKAAGEEYSGEREAWLVAQGYAYKKGAAKTDKLHVTDVKADKDPTLAANREAPHEDIPTTEEPSDDPAYLGGASQDAARSPHDVARANAADHQARRDAAEAGSAAVTAEDEDRKAAQAKADEAKAKADAAQEKVHREAFKNTVEDGANDHGKPTLGNA